METNTTTSNKAAWFKLWYKAGHFDVESIYRYVIKNLPFVSCVPILIVRFFYFRGNNVFIIKLTFCV